MHVAARFFGQLICGKASVKKVGIVFVTYRRCTYNSGFLEACSDATENV
jgi:hypothetical protein